MKTHSLKILFIIVFFSLVDNIHGQGMNLITTTQVGKQYYAGSLKETSPVIYQKLKIEVFGGNWHKTNLGTRTYTISARDGIAINQEIRGGQSDYYVLKIYKTASGYDFVVETTQPYTSLWIQAWLLDSDNFISKPMVPVNIVQYSATDKTDVTSEYPIQTLYSTTYTGDIGIGTATPKEKLDVAGTIRAKEVKVEVNAGADHVFNEDYNLKALSEVETFVKENKHLPEIQSEKQMQEEGLNINEFQIKLLKKIEELTLYVIEQDKTIKEQGKLIQTLQYQISPQ